MSPVKPSFYHHDQWRSVTPNGRSIAYQYASFPTHMALVLLGFGLNLLLLKPTYFSTEITLVTVSDSLIAQ